VSTAGGMPVGARELRSGIVVGVRSAVVSTEGWWLTTLTRGGTIQSRDMIPVMGLRFAIGAT